MKNSYCTKINDPYRPRVMRSHLQGWLRAAVVGHFRYYGVLMNQPALTIFRFRVGWQLASLAVAAKPERPCPLGSHAASHHSLAAFALCLPSLSSAAQGVVTYSDLAALSSLCVWCTQASAGVARPTGPP